MVFKGIDRCFKEWQNIPIWIEINYVFAIEVPQRPPRFVNVDPKVLVANVYLLDHLEYIPKTLLLGHVYFEYSILLLNHSN